MKKPMLLLISIFLSIIMLSILFPEDPTQPDIISRLKPNKTDTKETQTLSNNYKVININKLTGSGDALAWSPDEKCLYYSVHANNSGVEELWVCDMNGSKKRLAENTELYNISKAAFSPDGRMMAFISLKDDIANLMVYDIDKDEVKNITPRKTYDTGVTSYDWDNDSSSIIMSVDISNPQIEIYNFKTDKIARLDMELTNCRNVAYYGSDKIMYSDMDDGRYSIFSADRYGRNRKFITEGWEFKISPDRHKIAIISDADGQKGLWIYNIDLNRKNTLSSSIIYDVYWMQDSSSLMYSVQEDNRNNYAYKGYIYYYNKDNKVINISGAMYTIFIPSGTGNKIAMSSPEYVTLKKEETGIFLGELYKQP